MVNPALNAITSGRRDLTLEPLIMRLFSTLASASGELVSRQTLIEDLWENRAGSDEQLTLAVSKLRGVLKTLDPETPYIETIPKQGYRFIQDVIWPGPSPRAQDKRPSIAVMAFADMSPSQDHEYFGDGMAEEILNALAKVPNLRIAARTSSFSFKGKNQNLRDVGLALNVTHLLEGSVRVMDDRLRVTVQLIRSEDGFHMWSETYDGLLKDVFDLQDAISRAISKTLITQLDLDGPRLALNLTSDETAYNLFLQGRALNARHYGEGVLSAATDLLEKAIELDPGFARAHAELAHSYSLAATYTVTNKQRDLVERATRRARIAARFNPRLGFPVTLMAFGAFTNGDIVGAIDLAQQAYQLEPDNADVILRLGFFHAAIGRTQYAIPLLEKAVAFDPIQGRNHHVLGMALVSNDEFDTAEIHAKRALDLHHYFAAETYVMAAFARGDYDLAGERLVANVAQMIKMVGSENVFGKPLEAVTGWEQMAIYSVSADKAKRKAVAEWMYNVTYEPGKTPEITLLQNLIRGGLAETFFDLIGDTPLPGRNGCLLSLWDRAEPATYIRNHPDFMDFATRIGMARAWRKYGYPDRMQ